MRYIVLILGIIGAAACGVFGFRWMKDLQDSSTTVELTRNVVEEARKQSMPVPREVEEEYTKIVGRTRTWPLLLANAVLGLLGGVLAFTRRSWAAAIVLLAATIAPAVIYPVTLILTFALGLGGALALLIRTKPQPASVATAAHAS
jgi:hypothetical protein